MAASTESVGLKKSTKSMKFMQKPTSRYYDSNEADKPSRFKFSPEHEKKHVFTEKILKDKLLPSQSIKKKIMRSDGAKANVKTEIKKGWNARQREKKKLQAQLESALADKKQKELNERQREKRKQRSKDGPGARSSKSTKNLNNEKKFDKFEPAKYIPQSKVAPFIRGKNENKDAIRTPFESRMFERKQRKLNRAARQAARTDILLPEETGFLEVEKGEDTFRIRQQEIKESVDISSAEKHFELTLDQFGPYRMNYSRNGRFLLLGGEKGHIAAMDWQPKRLMCELNVMESIRDVQWLHLETMYAVAQKQWTYVYDNQGIELHCLKMLDQVLRLEFLPYHFLLASSNAKGYLCYIDVSIGQKVAGYSTGYGRLDVMTQNPSNAVICMGHTTGTVTMWTPNRKNSVAKVLCHAGGVRSIAIDHRGTYMATAGLDRKIKIWDLRNYKMLQSYKVPAGPGSMCFSHKGLLATSMGNVVQVYKDCCQTTTSKPYMAHQLNGSVYGVQFCPYEDVLGVSHAKGYTSLIIPGAGEANFDALESNPYQTKKQRQQLEVKMLLDKVNPEHITLDTSMLGQVDEKTYVEKIEERNKIPYLAPVPLEFTPKYKKKGRSKAGRIETRKQNVQLEYRKKEGKKIMEAKRAFFKEVKKNQKGGKPDNNNKPDVFSRFNKNS